MDFGRNDRSSTWDGMSYFDKKWEEEYAKCHETERQASMRTFSRELLKETKEKFGVQFSIRDYNYY